MDYNKKMLKEMDRSFPLHTLKGNVYIGKVCEVYDANTLDAIIYAPEEDAFRRYRMKLNGYNPIPHTYWLKTIETLEALWQYATDTDMFTYEHETLVRVECGDWDKYGRLQTTIYRVNNDDLDDVMFCVNDAMVQSGHGVPATP
jgi:hypothetical protein